jgi:hypothetical protein
VFQVEDNGTGIIVGKRSLVGMGGLGVEGCDWMRCILS